MSANPLGCVVCPHPDGSHHGPCWANPSPYQTVERMAELVADNERLRSQAALMTERWLRAEEDAERLAAGLTLVRDRSNIAEYLDVEGHLGVIHALGAHDKRKAEEA